MSLPPKCGPALHSLVYLTRREAGRKPWLRESALFSMQTLWLRAEQGLMPVAGKDKDDIHESASVQYCCCQGSLSVTSEGGALPAATEQGKACGFARRV